MSEIRDACNMLIDFVDEYQEIYGPSAVTLNLHLLRHYFEMIMNCGPLWSYSLFGFENNIGQLKKYVVGTTDVLDQIAHKYSIDRGDYEEPSVPNDQHTVMCQPNTIIIEPKYKDLLLSNGVVSYESCEQNMFQIWRRIRIKNITYTSMKARETKSIDYFVKMNDGKMGKILFFVQNNSVPHLLLNTFESSFKNHHWTEITDEKCYSLYPCSEINEKMLYFKIGSIEFVTQEPNTYGKCSY